MPDEEMLDDDDCEENPVGEHLAEIRSAFARRRGEAGFTEAEWRAIALASCEAYLGAALFDRVADHEMYVDVTEDGKVVFGGL